MSDNDLNVPNEHLLATSTRFLGSKRRHFEAISEPVVSRFSPTSATSHTRSRKSETYHPRGDGFEHAPMGRFFFHRPLVELPHLA